MLVQLKGVQACTAMKLKVGKIVSQFPPVVELEEAEVPQVKQLSAELSRKGNVRRKLHTAAEKGELVPTTAASADLNSLKEQVAEQTKSLATLAEAMLKMVEVKNGDYEATADKKAPAKAAPVPHTHRLTGNEGDIYFRRPVKVNDHRLYPAVFILRGYGDVKPGHWSIETLTTLGGHRSTTIADRELSRTARYTKIWPTMADAEAVEE